MLRTSFLRLAALAAISIGIYSPLPAQEGHPLVGTWRGTVVTAPNVTKDVVVYMEWDGKALTGLINPGPDMVKLTKAELIPDGWKLHLEAQGVVADGTINQITSLRRTITGTWTQAGQKGTFTLQRPL
jgi:hypothetical protein